MNLYIIGNGFDLAHDLSTSFSSFRKFMEKVSRDSVDRWSKIINIKLDENWNNLEESFQYVDYEYISELCSTFLHSYNEENWSESYHHDYQNEISKYLDLIINSDFYLRNWLNNVYKKSSKKFILEKDSLYLTFNYTNVLEDVYRIEKNNICHIHGDINSNDKLILGHANPRILLEMENIFYDDDVRIIEGTQIFNNSKQDSYKDSESLINENIDFFEKCKSINTIYIIGHSVKAMYDVDFKYYKKITSLININEVVINVVVYNNLDIEEYEKFLRDLGFKNINFLTYDDICI